MDVFNQILSKENIFRGRDDGTGQQQQQQQQQEEKKMFRRDTAAAAAASAASLVLLETKWQVRLQLVESTLLRTQRQLKEVNADRALEASAAKLILERNLMEQADIVGQLLRRIDQLSVVIVAPSPCECCNALRFENMCLLSERNAISKKADSLSIELSRRLVHFNEPLNVEIKKLKSKIEQVSAEKKAFMEAMKLIACQVFNEKRSVPIVRRFFWF